MAITPINVRAGSTDLKGLSSDTKPTVSDENHKLVPNQTLFIETDTGSVYKWMGNGWELISSGGRTHTLDAFAPSQDYVHDLTMDGTAQSIALATGVKLGAGRITVWNNGATTEDIRVAFGTSAANAEANLTIAAAAATTGMQIPPYADNGPQSFQMFKVPDNATHVAVANAVAADTQAVQIVQGV